MIKVSGEDSPVIGSQWLPKKNGSNQKKYKHIHVCFLCLAMWWNCLGRIRICGIVGDVLLEANFEVSNDL